ncbi:hypothetical protein C1645_767448 [Glomus cerebriforme]|uniref:Uncharacterized protein n=1 Tax=Glomus cerebriforme TaxID=658196 RepID=A0A397T5K0_9GLOM|nr:hypothetical protein C1645_767448 [Glomus cerebriforme]
MILGGFGIEILVNDNKPLREYSDLYDTSKEQNTMKPSLIRDVNTNKCYESDRTVFVAVPKSGMKYTIRLWADSATTSKTYRVRACVDGTWDRAAYTLTDAHSTVIEYYNDDNDRRKRNFVFASSSWTDDESKIKDNKIGCIVLEFFEARWTLIENDNVIKDSNDILFEQYFNYSPQQPDENEGIRVKKPKLDQFQKMLESPLSEEEKTFIKRIGDLNGAGSAGVGSYYGWKSADKPSAVLRVHYRPKMWLKSKGFAPEPLYSRFSPGIPSESENSEDEDSTIINNESEVEIEIEREQLRRRDRTHKSIDFDDERYRKRRAEKYSKHVGNNHNRTSEGTKSNYKRLKANNKNKSIGKCNGKMVDSSRKDKKISNTSNVKFARYFEEIIEETKYIDIEVSSNEPAEEIRQNKKLREIIEILDSDDEI